MSLFVLVDSGSSRPLPPVFDFPLVDSESRKPQVEVSSEGSTTTDLDS